MTGEALDFRKKVIDLYQRLLPQVDHLRLRLDEPARHSEIAHVEKQHRIKIPADVTVFLKTVTGNFELAFEHPSIENANFRLGLDSIAGAATEWAAVVEEEPELKRYVALDSGMNGDYLVICSETGRIFATAHELDLCEPLFLVANSASELAEIAISVLAPSVIAWSDLLAEGGDAIDLVSEAARERQIRD